MTLQEAMDSGFKAMKDYITDEFATFEKRIAFIEARAAAAEGRLAAIEAREAEKNWDHDGGLRAIAGTKR